MHEAAVPPAQACTFSAARRGSVAVLFAIALIPLLFITALGVDTAFYVQAEAQVQLTADAAAMNAVHTAVTNVLNGETVAQATAGAITTGSQWFDAELGVLPTAVNVQRSVNVSFNAASSTFTAAVSYSATVPTHIGRVMQILQWPLSGSASAVMTTLSYVEVEMLIDNSSSMLIGATDSDIVAMENLTLCTDSTTAAAAGQGMGSYAWVFPATIGYGSNGNTPTQTPPTASKTGACESNFSGPADQCFYPISPSTSTVKGNGFCPANTGIYSTAYQNWVPQAPCALACHTGDEVHDYYTVVRNASPKITLRFDVIQQAAQQVIQSMEQQQQVANQFAIGVFEFNAGVTQVHPAGSGFVESDTNLSQAATDVQSITTPIVNNAADTNFPNAASYLASNFTAAGTGLSPLSRHKNLFIITDGMEDATVSGSRIIGQMTNPANETYCQPIKNLGFTIYVLYTPYTPLANSWYLNPSNTVITNAESTTGDAPIVSALKACASLDPNGNPLYYEASSQADINTAMQSMLKSAISASGRLAN